MKRLVLLLSGVLACAGIALYFFGRGLWQPLFAKPKGERSIEEAVAALKSGAKKPFAPEDWQKLVLVGLKQERMLEVWGIRRDGTGEKLRVFPFTGFSGTLGPKLREGDRQIPEGIYSIEYLNPNSSYHLSMKLNYPNAFDREMGRRDGRSNLGFDIFIHGRSATVGCIPIGDEAIEELFLMVAEMGIQNVGVILAPYDMRKGGPDVPAPDLPWAGELYSSIREALQNSLPEN